MLPNKQPYSGFGTNNYEQVTENNGHKLFGKNSFEAMVNKVADIEKSLRTYELSQFTPKI